MERLREPHSASLPQRPFLLTKPSEQILGLNKSNSQRECPESSGRDSVTMRPWGLQTWGLLRTIGNSHVEAPLKNCSLTEVTEHVAMRQQLQSLRAGPSDFVDGAPH